MFEKFFKILRICEIEIEKLLLENRRRRIDPFASLISIFWVPETFKLPVILSVPHFDHVYELLLRL